MLIPNSKFFWEINDNLVPSTHRPAKRKSSTKLCHAARVGLWCWWVWVSVVYVSRCWHPLTRTMSCVFGQQGYGAPMNWRHLTDSLTTAWLDTTNVGVRKLRWHFNVGGMHTAFPKTQPRTLQFIWDIRLLRWWNSCRVSTYIWVLYTYVPKKRERKH